MADAGSMQDHWFYSSFMGSQVCRLIPREIPCCSTASQTIKAHPDPAEPHKATACPGAAASCPARGCPQGGFNSTPPSLLCSQFSVRVSAVNYICLSARAANLLSPSGEAGGQKTKVTPSHCASCHLQSRLVSLTNSWLNTTS